MARMVLSGFLWVLPVAFWGCCSADPIATYPWVDAPTALRIMTQRGQSIQTLQAPDCTIRLTRADGESVRLDAVLVSRPPDYLRLRASKFGRVVIDLTLTPQGLWILESQDSAGGSSGETATANLKTVTARQLASAWSILAGQQFDHPDLKVTDHGASTFR